jgi:hypothetical protein
MGEENQDKEGLADIILQDRGYQQILPRTVSSTLDMPRAKQPAALAVQEAGEEVEQLCV